MANPFLAGAQVGYGFTAGLGEAYARGVGFRQQQEDRRRLLDQADKKMMEENRLKQFESQAEDARKQAELLIRQGESAARIKYLGAQTQLAGRKPGTTGAAKKDPYRMDVAQARLAIADEYRMLGGAEPDEETHARIERYRTVMDPKYQPKKFQKKPGWLDVIGGVMNPWSQAPTPPAEAPPAGPQAPGEFDDVYRRADLIP